VDFIKETCLYIGKSIKPSAKIYTTNFDTLLEPYLSPEHIHGKFALPLREMQDVILYLDRVKDRFEYVYLFGTNGFEKLNRLNLLREFNQGCYDLDFFFKEDLVLGHLLIFGISFGYIKIMPDYYLEEHPEHKSFHLLRSVDGHIVSRIDALFKQGKIDKVTISYYTDEDLDNIKNIVETTAFKSVVEYKHSTEIFDFNTLM
jgi:hypothetical protein